MFLVVPLTLSTVVMPSSCSLPFSVPTTERQAKAKPERERRRRGATRIGMCLRMHIDHY